MQREPTGLLMQQVWLLQQQVDQVFTLIHPSLGKSSLTVMTVDSLKMLNNRANATMQVKSLVTQVVPLCVISTGRDYLLCIISTWKSSSLSFCQDFKCSTTHHAVYENQIDNNFKEVRRCTFMYLQPLYRVRHRNCECLKVNSHEDEQRKIIELASYVPSLWNDDTQTILKDTTKESVEKRPEIHLTLWVQGTEKVKSWEKKKKSPRKCINLLYEEFLKLTFQAGLLTSIDGEDYHSKVLFVARSHYYLSTLRNEINSLLKDYEYTTFAQVSTLGPLYIPSILRNTMVYPIPSVIHMQIGILSTFVPSLLTNHITSTAFSSLTTLSPLQTFLPLCFSRSHLICHSSMIHTSLLISHMIVSCCVELLFVALILKLFIYNITYFLSISGVRDDLCAHIPIIGFFTMKVECPFYWHIYKLYLLSRYLEIRNWYLIMNHHKLACLKREKLNKPFSVIFNLKVSFAHTFRTSVLSTPTVFSHIMPFTLSIIFFTPPPPATSITPSPITTNDLVTLESFPVGTHSVPVSCTPTMQHHVPTIIAPSMISITPPLVNLSILPPDTPIISSLFTCVGTSFENAWEKRGNADRSIKKNYITGHFSIFAGCWCFSKAAIHCLPYVLYLPLWWWTLFMMVWTSLDMRMCLAESSFPSSGQHSQLDLLRHSLAASGSKISHTNSLQEYHRDHGHKCHHECAGGCTQPMNHSSCYDCQHYKLGSSCVGTCPRRYFKYETSSIAQCVSKMECLAMKDHHILDSETRRECLASCPIGYDLHGHTCYPHVCGSKRIVNNVSSLETLRGCRVVEGNLQIVLIEDAPRNREEEWQKWTYPELVQITGFLLVYRVSGLRSLGQLFPNLAVIRGMNLHQNYALVIYDAVDLESVDLYSLTAILRGSVRIQKNFNLCYVDTVDWSIIVKDVSENVINNNNEVMCSPCYPPGRCSQRGELERCWSSTHCQKVCEMECVGGCASSGECCHDQCAGGCKKPNDSKSCHACRHYNSSGICNETCYKDFYEYRKYQCVTKNDCGRMGHLRYISEDRSKKECVSDCPAGYYNSIEKERDNDVLICKKCHGPCAKTCPTQLVNTVAKAQKLTGCTRIEGPLIISITGGKTIVEELNASLGLIEEVTEYVRVFSSHALLSLSFLASLRVIGGASLYNGKYALYVHGNDNLEEIWSWETHPNLTITERNATVLFHSNPKLCYKKIKNLILSIGRNITEDCNMELTNGNKVACTIMKQPVYVEALAEKGVVEVRWKAAPINEDDRMLTGYYIYYKPSKEKIIDHMTGRDACNDNWSRRYVEINKSEVNIKTRLEGLKPYTQYALYVQSDTVVDADSGVKSEISYVTTLSHNPSSPRDVIVPDVGTNWMTLTWQPPSFPNGRIYHYIIFIHLNPYRMDSSLDFCSMMTSQDKVKDIKESGKEPTSTTEAPSANEICKSLPQGATSEDCCPCSPDTVRQERQQDIDFEDRLYSFVYMHRSSRWKRSDSDLYHQEKYSSDLHESGPSIYMNYSSIRNSSESGVTVYMTDKQSYDIPNLRHFSRYQIEIIACHQPTSNCPNDSGLNLCALCSLNPVKIVETTKKLYGADLVSDLRASDIKSEILTVKWSPPAEPNGEIVAYRLSVRPDSTDRSSYEKCVTSQIFEENNSTYDLNVTAMDPGRYMLSVSAYNGGTLEDKSSEVPFVVKGKKNASHKMWAVLSILLLLLLVGAAAITYKIVCRKESFEETINPHYPHEAGLPLWTPDVYAMISSEHILDCSDLLLEESCQLGKGNFGIVMKGQLRHGSGLIPVAVKQVTDYQARDDILQEAKLMLKLKCYHLVHAYGVVPGPNHMFLVMELMSRGDLLKYLRSLRAQDNDIFSVLNVDDVCAMAIQIGDGMAYLASHKIVHRDLAARNCLVDDQLNIKISDFGMTRLTDKNYYKIRETKYFPVRWLPPEYLTSSKFTSQSDVWSYGIVFWEILTGGARPYQHLEDNSKVWEQVSRGYTLEAHLPRDTPTFLGKIVVSCWRFHGYQRPYFPHIIAALLPSASPCFLQHFRMVSFYHSPEGEEYKRLVETMQDVEDENDIATPLTTPSPIPFTPTHPQGPSMPPQPSGVLKWCPSFRLRSQATQRHTRHFTHAHTTDSAQNLSLHEQSIVDSSDKAVTQELSADSTLMVDVISTDKAKVVHPSPSKVFSASVKDNGFCSEMSLNNENVSGCSVREVSKPISQPNPPVIPSNVVVHINKHGLPYSAISSAATSNNISK